jgi:hypothetical protein
MAESDDIRDRKRPIKVYVSANEREKINAVAKQTRKNPSDLMRGLALGFEPRSIFDRDAIQELIKLHGDQGRLGGLLKLWLSEKKGEGAAATQVRNVLQQIESLQIELGKIVMKEKKRL